MIEKKEECLIFTTKGVRMKTILTLTIGSLLFLGCTAMESQAESEVDKYHVQRIFDYDNCVVYTFWDKNNSKFQYFFNCKNDDNDDEDFIEIQDLMIE